MCLIGGLFSNGFASGPRCYIVHQPDISQTKCHVLKWINIAMNCMDQTDRWKRKSDNSLKYLCGAHSVPGMNRKNHMREQYIRKKLTVKDIEVLSIQSLFSAHGDKHSHSSHYFKASIWGF